MKIEEAIERQRRLIKKWEDRITELEEKIVKYPHEKMRFNYIDDWRPIEIEQRKQRVEESKLIIAALEKQTPKEPKEYDGVLHYLCPTCNEDVFAYDHHCDCGQALKWEE